MGSSGSSDRPPERFTAGPESSPAAMTVYLLSIGRERFELYSEPPEEPGAPPGSDAGRLRQWAHVANAQWHELVDAARRGHGVGRVARWRDALVRRLAETIAEQRTLWALAQHRE